MNVGQLLSNAARQFPEHPAITWGDAPVTYAELDRRTDALAHGLTALGVARGDRVGVLMRNRPELLEAMFACFKAGFCLVPLNSRFTADDIAYHVDDSGAVAVLTDPEGVAPVRARRRSTASCGGSGHRRRYPTGSSHQPRRRVIAGAAD